MSQSAQAKNIVYGQLQGVDPSTVSTDELIDFVKQAGHTLAIGTPRPREEWAFSELFRELAFDRQRGIFRRCRDANPNVYQSYNEAFDKLDSFLEEHLSKADFQKYRRLYCEIESESLSPWYCAHQDALYLGGLRDGMRLADFIRQQRAEADPDA